MLVDGLLYVADPKTTDVLALEPETGKEVWRHKPPAGLNGGDIRGLSYWGGDGSMKPRIIMIWGHSMFGLDLKTGQFTADWPATGHTIMLPPVGLSCASESACGGVPQKSPPVICKNLLILSEWLPALPGPASRPARLRSAHRQAGVDLTPGAGTRSGRRRFLGARPTACGGQWLVGHPLAG